MRRWLTLSLSTTAVAATAAALLLAGRPAQAEAGLAGAPMIVHKSPSCSCCGDYIDALRAHGVEVTVIETDDAVGVKATFGVPPSTWSCHTAELAGYAVEGHVPMDALERLLAERPDVDGIALPGMPPGSPGMPGTKSAPFEVVGFDEGETRAFGSF